MIHVPVKDHDAAELAPLFFDDGGHAGAVHLVVSVGVPSADERCQVGVVQNGPAPVSALLVFAFKLHFVERLRQKHAVLLDHVTHVAGPSAVIEPRIRPRPVVLRRLADGEQLRLELIRNRPVPGSRTGGNKRNPNCQRQSFHDLELHFRIFIGTLKTQACHLP